MGYFVGNTRGRTVSVGNICVATDWDIDLSSQSVCRQFALTVLIARIIDPVSYYLVWVISLVYRIAFMFWIFIINHIFIIFLILARTSARHTSDLTRLIESHDLHPHGYADDTQIYGSCSEAGVQQLQECMSVCIDDVALWMWCNRLQLNTAKTEVFWSTATWDPSGSGRCWWWLCLTLHHCSSVRDLGFYLDCDASMKNHVSKTVANCFAAVRQMHSVWRSITRPVLLSLVSALVIVATGLR